MPSTLYLDAARMGQMAPSAQWALHDFVRLAGEEGCTLYFEQFLQSGFAALTANHQKRYPGLRCWGGLDELKAALADFAGLPVSSRPLVAGRSANLMKLAARLLFERGNRVLVTDLSWPSYRRILERETRKSAGEVNRVRIRDAILGGTISGAELVDLMVRACRGRKCNGVFIPEISHDGIRLPVTEIVAALRQIDPALFVVVDGAQALGHVPLSLTHAPCDFFVAGCHKWLGSHLPLGIGFLPNPATRTAIERRAAELIVRRRLDDPLDMFLQNIESGRMRRFTETVNLSPLFSCRGALEDQFAAGPIADRLQGRLANADLTRRIARMTAWNPLTPMAEFRSASVLLQSPSIRNLAPDRLRSLFHDRSISVTSYIGGVVRLAMPSVPPFDFPSRFSYSGPGIGSTPRKLRRGCQGAVGITFTENVFNGIDEHARRLLTYLKQHGPFSEDRICKGLQEMKHLHQASNREIQGAQAEHGEDVGRAEETDPQAGLRRLRLTGRSKGCRR